MYKLSLLAVSFIATNAAYWENWDRRQQCWPQELIRPTSEAEVVSAIKSAGKEVGFKAAGAGHSFSGIPLTEGVLFQLDGMKDILSHAPRKDG